MEERVSFLEWDNSLSAEAFRFSPISTPRCRDRGGNQCLIECILHKHHTIHPFTKYKEHGYGEMPKFLRFAFGGKAYQYRVLPFGLALSPRTFTKCVDAALAPRRLQGIRIMNYIDDWLILAHSHQLAVQHRDVVLAHMKELGLRLNAKKSVLSPLQRTTFLGVVWDSVSMQARLSPPRVDSILAAEKSVKLGQLLTVKQFQRLLGLMAAASNGIPFGLLHMRPLQWWLRTRGFSPRGNPFRTIKVTRRCLRALVMWKKPWFLSQGPVQGAPCRRKLLTTDASLTGWGAILRVAHLKVCGKTIIVPGIL
ncbi:hypothetical protein PO909_015306 [Leuciscus waleckii]